MAVELPVHSVYEERVFWFVQKRDCITGGGSVGDRRNLKEHIVAIVAIEARIARVAVSSLA